MIIRTALHPEDHISRLHIKRKKGKTQGRKKKGTNERTNEGRGHVDDPSLSMATMQMAKKKLNKYIKISRKYYEKYSKQLDNK